MIRILTANLWNGGADPRALAELLERERVDIAALQELAPEQARAVQEVLPHGKLEPSRDFVGMGIAARRNLDVSRYAMPCRDARVAEVDACEWGLTRSFELINAHLIAPHAWPPWRTYAVRRAQVARLMARLRSAPRARLLVGDLNATPLWPAYRTLRRELADLAHHTPAWPRRTWGPTPAWPRLLRIDHALGSGLEVGDVEVLPVEGSDHSAVLISLCD